MAQRLHMQSEEVLTLNESKAVPAIFWGGLIAGALDIIAACVSSWLRAGFPPTRVLQSVASGILGAAAYSGGAKIAVLGLALHFFIATTWTTVFYFASRKLRFLIERPVTWGLVYGLIVYAFMNFVVLPLSAFPQRTPPRLSGRIIGLLIIMFCVGLPIALIVRRFSRRS
ncbi:MAG TPA: hypothetical protein VGW58_17195 [Pyrinomonadaceae bacterium]|nr:hypothetical protein [Pyrinomonadaceae bacterium]